MDEQPDERRVEEVRHALRLAGRFSTVMLAGDRAGDDRLMQSVRMAVVECPDEPGLWSIFSGRDELERCTRAELDAAVAPEG